MLHENIGLIAIYFLPKLYGADHVMASFLSWSEILCGRNVKIERGVSFSPPGSFASVSIGYLWIGLNAIILPNVVIGENSILVGGVPAKIN